MNTPFVVEVSAPEPERGERLARLLADELDARHVGVRRDGRLLHEGQPVVDVDVDTRRAPPQHPALRIGVRAPDGRPLWLQPLPLPEDPAEAAGAAVGFLERWGFVGALEPADAPTRSAQRSAQPSAA